MSATSALVHLAGYVALLLWGLQMVSGGLLRGFGNELRRIVGRGLRNRLAAVGAGVVVTGLLQSSTATGLMASSFTASGMVPLVPALAIMLGANIGTALIVQVFSFDITLVFPALVLVGVGLSRHATSSRARDLGSVLIGLGLMLLAIHLLIELTTPQRVTPAMRELLAAITGDPLANLLGAALLAWAAHSSVAVILLAMSLADSGLIPTVAALAMVLGANVGSALNPVLEAGGDRMKLRLPIGNLVSRLIGCAIALPLLVPIDHLLPLLGADPGRMTANFHLTFNLALAALMILPLPLMARLLERVLPPRRTADDPGLPRYLDPATIDTPSVALASAAREVLRMADIVEEMLHGARKALRTGDRQRVAEIKRMDDILDRLHRALEVFATSLGRQPLDAEERRRLSETLAFALSLEHIGDIIDRNLMQLAAKKITRHLSLAPDAAREIDDLCRRLVDQLQLAIAVFMAGDLESARRLVEEKDHFRVIERAATERHFNRLRSGERESLDGGSLHLDLIRDLKRIEAHIAATAYPLLEASGELRPSRLELPQQHVESG